jgi:hypothetical protein
LPVKCSKACYQDGGGILGSTFEAMSAGNLVFGGVIGIGIDAMSGAMNKYPNQISVPMIPIPGCGSPPPATPTPSRQRKGAPPPAAMRPAVAPPVISQAPTEPEPTMSEADRSTLYLARRHRHYLMTCSALRLSPLGH